MKGDAETHDLYAFDAAFAAGKGGNLAGADEAGRGAFAGPIFAAAVVLGGDIIEGIGDSKQLSASAREFLLPRILESARAVSVVAYPAWFIDRNGVGAANRDALSRSLDLVSEQAGCKLADGRLRLGDDVTSLPRADSQSAAVACASVVAKVLRDHAMRHLAVAHPEYGFEQNKGYGTSSHRTALEEVGACRVHRFSYSGVG